MKLALKKFDSLQDSIDSSLRGCETVNKEPSGQIHVGGAQFDEHKNNSQSNGSEKSLIGPMLKNTNDSKRSTSNINNSGKK